ncbi:MAG: DUF1275 domain-containing protein [Deltaproteobacteria bacterium]|nr:DUF1275 domain-containing protein [Deltaproteobacteria bacterium]
MGGLLCVHVFVSHVTGYAAHLALTVYDHQYLHGIYFLTVPMFFLLGSVFSGAMSERRAIQNKPPVYIHILLFLSLSFAGLSVVGTWGFFGMFGKPLHDFHGYTLLCILAFACGSQNALFTNYSNSIIRTTHLTGLTTDLGIGLAKYFIGKKQSEKKINRIRIELICTFILGSIVGAYLFPAFEFYAFLIPCAISLTVGWGLFVSRKKLQLQQASHNFSRSQK